MDILALLTVLKVYLDNCCYGRRFDRKTNLKVKMEAVKIRKIIKNRIKGGYVIIGSFAVEYEINQIAHNKKRTATEKHYKKAIAGHKIELSPPIITRARELESKGLREMDSFHLAAAEAAGADVLITTDADFIRICAKKYLTTIKVINPLNF